MGHGWGYASVVIAAAVATWLWDRRRERRVPSEQLERESKYYEALGKRILLAVVLLAVALVLASLGVGPATWVAFALLFVFTALTLIGPWLKPRRRPQD